MREIDARRLACPGPVIELRRMLESGEPAVRMLVADELARSNVTRFATSRGADVTSEPTADGGFAVTVEASTGGVDSAKPDPSFEVCPVAEREIGQHSGGPLVVHVTSTVMGHGDDELGQLLMRSFLKTQIQLERRPDTVIFYNSGVKLCCEGSPLLGDLTQLEAAGTEVLACGTCLNFFDLADRLRIGRVTDMLEIATRLAGAGSVVRP